MDDLVRPDATVKELSTHIMCAVNLVRCVRWKEAVELSGPPELNFWNIPLGIMLDVASIEWCKLFGANSEATHWKNVIVRDRHEEFRTGLWRAMSMTDLEFADYRNEIKTYRDELASHQSMNPKPAFYPEFGPALKACYFFYELLQPELLQRGGRGYPEDLGRYSKEFVRDCFEKAQTAVKSTNDMNEIVY